MLIAGPQTGVRLSPAWAPRCEHRCESVSVANAALARSRTVLHELYPTLAGPLPPDPSSLPRPLLRLPDKLQCLWVPTAPDGKRVRYRVLHGGRGGAKSWGVAKTLLVKGAEKKLRILCTRELQVSIKDSVHKLLDDQIQADPWLALVYDVQKTTIVNRITGTEFIFAGVKNNVKSVKSMEGVDICWVEEAENVTDYSWQVIIPTIRKPGSEIWITFNPDEEKDPTSRRFIQGNSPPGTIVCEIGWQDNPWFPEELREEKDYLYKIDPEAADHVWGGQYRKNSAAQIFRGRYKVESFTPEPEWDGPYFGADFGFSVDPSTLVKMYVHKNKLYVSEEAYGHGVDTDEMPAFYSGGTIGTKTFQGVTGCKKRPIRADCARPETISYLQRHGFGNAVGCKKWAGSVEDGIEFIKSFEEIIIHPRCKHAIEEARLYCYKVDRLTKEPTTDVDDKHNHIWDAIRYALEPLLLQKNMGMLNYMKELSAQKES